MEKISIFTHTSFWMQSVQIHSWNGNILCIICSMGFVLGDTIRERGGGDSPNHFLPYLGITPSTHLRARGGGGGTPLIISYHICVNGEEAKNQNLHYMIRF